MLRKIRCKIHSKTLQEIFLKIFVVKNYWTEFQINEHKIEECENTLDKKIDFIKLRLDA